MSQPFLTPLLPLTLTIFLLKALFFGRRWLSGPHLPSGCFDICHNGPPLGNGNESLCQVGGEKYLMKSDLSVWYPIEFAQDGSIKPMKPMTSFTLELPDVYL